MQLTDAGIMQGWWRVTYSITGHLQQLEPNISEHIQCIIVYIQRNTNSIHFDQVNWIAFSVSIEHKLYCIINTRNSITRRFFCQLCKVWLSLSLPRTLSQIYLWIGQLSSKDLVRHVQRKFNIFNIRNIRMIDRSKTAFFYNHGNRFILARFLQL